LKRKHPPVKIVQEVEVEAEVKEEVEVGLKDRERDQGFVCVRYTNQQYHHQLLLQIHYHNTTTNCYFGAVLKAAGSS
jgi:hypothetical protein